MGRSKIKDDRGMDAQVLLLRDPGAELGWAELSDTLPSVGESGNTSSPKQISYYIYLVTFLVERLSTMQCQIHDIQCHIKTGESSDWQ